MKSISATLISTGLICTGLICTGLARPAIAADTGAYLTRAADCVACHTAAGGQEFTGGRAFNTPFGVIYSPNITPDLATGIGAYTDTEWLAALRRGIGRGGRHLYPAMPYTNYTQLSDADALAIKSYLFTLPASHAPARPAQLRFPFNQRWGLAFWNIANNPDRRFAPDPGHDADWNRGAYLVEGLGHCSQCHSPRNWMSGVKTGDAAYGGAVQQGWLAYNITADKDHGIGAWSNASLAQYLATGQTAGHGPASGPMAEVVTNSLRHLTADDINAMVTYLRSIPAIAKGPPATSSATSAAVADPLGARVFDQACAGCHLPNGAGRQSDWAALAGIHSASDPAGTNIIQALVQGSTLQTPQGEAFMHPYTAAFTDSELAAVTRFVAARFGNTDATVTATEIAKARAEPK